MRKVSEIKSGTDQIFPRANAQSFPGRQYPMVVSKDGINVSDAFVKNPIFLIVIISTAMAAAKLLVGSPLKGAPALETMQTHWYLI
jgi:hypothetical protein